MAWTNGVDYATLDVITAAIWDSYLGATGSLMSTGIPIIKSATETVNNSSTLQSDDAFLFTATALHDYEVIMCLLVSSVSATPDFKFAWTLTNLTWDGVYDNSYAAGVLGRTIVSAQASAAALSLASGTIPASLPVYLAFHIHAGATGGTANFQWAQASATVENTQVLKNSWMRYRDLGAS